jgi:hypothetical protein
VDTNRRAGIVVGALFIIGTLAGILSVVATQSVLGSPDYLVEISAHKGEIAAGAACVLIMGLGLAMVPVAGFSIFRKQNETLAVGYLVFRGALETMGYLATVISWLLLLQLSDAYVQAPAADAAGFQALGSVLQSAAETATNLGSIIFPLGAMMFYALLYQGNLIPRWLSIWGLIGVILILASAGLLGTFGLVDPESAIVTLLGLPIFIQEMVMAVWLIVKGFSPSTVAATPATHERASTSF